jgi:hypothetical protein
MPPFLSNSWLPLLVVDLVLTVARAYVQEGIPNRQFPGSTVVPCFEAADVEVFDMK